MNAMKNTDDDLPEGAEELRLLTAADLGKLIGRGTSTIKVDVYRRPETLPPRFIVPGTNGLHWRVCDVRRWMDAIAAVMEADRAAGYAKKSYHLGSKALARRIKQ